MSVLATDVVCICVCGVGNYMCVPACETGAYNYIPQGR